MTLILLGLAIAVIAFVYITHMPSPHGAPLGCAGLLCGIVIVLVAIVRLIFV